MIQLQSESSIFFMLKKSDVAFLQASKAYFVDMIGTLFYLLKKILNLIPTFFLFLAFLIHDFLDFFMNFWIFLVTLFFFVLQFQDLIGTSFFDSPFSFQQFLGTYTFHLSVALQDFPDDLCSDNLFQDVRFIRYFSLGYCLIDLLLS